MDGTPGIQDVCLLPHTAAAPVFYSFNGDALLLGIFPRGGFAAMDDATCLPGLYSTTSPRIPLNNEKIQFDR